jgi:hypothetical protein
MKFVLLLYGNPEYWAKTPSDQVEEDLRLHGEFVKYLEEQGIKQVGGEAVQDAPTAVTVRRGGRGELRVTDGPFAETKEQLGGFYVIEAADLAQAVEVAKKCPLDVATEVRPVWEMPT